MPNFQYVQPTDEQKEKMQEFRNKYQQLSTEMLTEFASSRGLSLAITKLEESAFWLNKAITEND
jgi:hypothetical protein